jgi:hypothetical protein
VLQALPYLDRLDYVSVMVMEHICSKTMAVSFCQSTYLQRETEEKARQPEIKLSIYMLHDHDNHEKAI